MPSAIRALGMLIRVRGSFVAPLPVPIFFTARLKEPLMRRHKTLAKALSAGFAILILAAGCTAQNPIAPDAENSERSIYANGMG